MNTQHYYMNLDKNQRNTDMHIALLPAIRFEEASQRAIPVIGLYYLASYVEKLAPDVKISVCRTPEEAIALSPNAVGISSVTENMLIAENWAVKIKEALGVPLILGGDHISALPKTLPKVFDAGVIGEGEETFLQLIKLMKNDSFHLDDYSNILGVCYYKNDKIEITPPRPLIEPMDSIPFPRREKELWGGFIYCFTSRGCPYKCTFCSPAIIWKKYRAFSAEYVMGELREIFRNFEPYYIHFFDDLFIGDPLRIKKLKELIRREGYHKRVNFGGHIRADMMTDELCEDLKGMNFVSGSFGAESGSDKVLKFLKCSTTNVEMNQKAIDICYKWGIQLNISFIIGTPGETEEDLKKTIDFIERNRKKLIGIEIFILLPYPGTPVWNYAKKRGLVSENMNWDLFKTKAYFSQFDADADFLYMNEQMDRKTFGKYVKIFQDIDASINWQNLNIYENIEKEVISSSKYKDHTNKNLTDQNPAKR